MKLKGHVFMVSSPHLLYPVVLTGMWLWYGGIGGMPWTSTYPGHSHLWHSSINAYLHSLKDMSSNSCCTLETKTMLKSS